MHTPDTQEPAADKAHGLSNVDQLGGEIETNVSSHFSRTQERVPVHFRGMLVGFVIAVSAGFEAVTTGGIDLGRFNRPHAAAHALMAKAGARCDG